MEQKSLKKSCSVCKNEKALDDFHINRQAKFGRQPRCKDCACTANRQVQKEKRERRKLEGVCINCGRKPYRSSYICLICRLRVTCTQATGRGTIEDVTVLLTKLFEQNKKCPYTGEHLEIGVNAELDHIQPRKRFPELASSLENLEWVSNKVNWMKRDLTKEEFIGLCRLIAKRSEQEE